MITSTCVMNLETAQRPVFDVCVRSALRSARVRGRRTPETTAATRRPRSTSTGRLRVRLQDFGGRDAGNAGAGESAAPRLVRERRFGPVRRRRRWRFGIHAARETTAKAGPPAAASRAVLLRRGSGRLRFHAVRAQEPGRLVGAQEKPAPDRARPTQEASPEERYDRRGGNEPTAQRQRRRERQKQLLLHRRRRRRRRPQRRLGFGWRRRPFEFGRRGQRRRIHRRAGRGGGRRPRPRPGVGTTGRPGRRLGTARQRQRGLGGRTSESRRGGVDGRDRGHRFEAQVLSSKR